MTSAHDADTLYMHMDQMMATLDCMHMQIAKHACLVAELLDGRLSKFCLAAISALARMAPRAGELVTVATTRYDAQLTRGAMCITTMFWPLVSAATLASARANSLLSASSSLKLKGNSDSKVS